MNDAVAAAGPFATILGHSRAGRCCSGAVAKRHVEERGTAVSSFEGRIESAVSTSSLCPG